jgi:intracellular septation protein A
MSTSAVLTEPDPSLEPRHLRLADVLRRLVMSLVVACAIPAALFYTCFRLDGVWTAIFAALAWSYGAIAWRALTGRRTSGLLVLTALVMTGRTGVALLTDSTFLYFLQPIITDGLIGTTFVLSLTTTRPMVSRLAGDFCPLDEEQRSRPRVRRLFQHLTLLWGLLCLGKATLTLWLLESQSMQTFLLVKSVSVLSLNAMAIGLTLGAAVVVARREGFLAPVPATA